MQAFSRAVQRTFADELVAWWRERFPWFHASVGDDVEAAALDVIAESAEHGYDRRPEIMRYSVGYIFFGARFAESPLHTDLVRRCRWHEAVAPSVRLARIVDHVDMLLWNRTFDSDRGPFHDLPALAAIPAGGAEVEPVVAALRGVSRRRLAHLDRKPEAVARYVEQARAAMMASKVPEDWQLRGAVLGVFLGWAWSRSPAFTWLVDAMRRDRTALLSTRLYGTDHA
jgi:hypothetical protein